MSQDRRKIKRKSKPTKNKLYHQITVLFYLSKKDALSDHLVSVCTTSGSYLKNYILPELFKQKLIKLKPFGKDRKLYTLTTKGREIADHYLDLKNKGGHEAEFLGLQYINLDELDL